jgi:hypothetical protein
MQIDKQHEIKRCEDFIKDNFLQMPSVNGVKIYSLFFNGGTFTDEEIIKEALNNVKPSQLFKRN